MRNRVASITTTIRRVNTHTHEHVLSTNKINIIWALINYSFRMQIGKKADSELSPCSVHDRGAACVQNIIKMVCVTCSFTLGTLFTWFNAKTVDAAYNSQTLEHNSFWFKYGAESDRINRECAFYVLCTSSVMSVYAFRLLFTTNNERNVWNLLLENILSRTFFWLLSVFVTSVLFMRCI